MNLYFCLLLHTFSTLFMTGVIWLVQMLNYPFIKYVDPQHFVQFYSQHTSRITFIVGPAMVIQLFAALGLWFIDSKNLYFAVFAVLSGLVFVATALFSVPYHTILAAGFRPEIHDKLVSYNWIRTIAWSAHSGLLLIYWLMSVPLPSFKF